MNETYARYRQDESFRNALQRSAHAARVKAIGDFIRALLKQPRLRPSRMLRRHTAFG